METALEKIIVLLAMFFIFSGPLLAQIVPKLQNMMSAQPFSHHRRHKTNNIYTKTANFDIALLLIHSGGSSMIALYADEFVNQRSFCWLRHVRCNHKRLLTTFCLSQNA